MKNSIKRIANAIFDKVDLEVGPFGYIINPTLDTEIDVPVRWIIIEKCGL